MEPYTPSTARPSNGQLTKIVTGQDPAKQRRALRKLIRDLVAFTGCAVDAFAAAPRKAPQRKRQRLLYRKANTLTDDEVKRIVVELGPDRVLRVVDRLTQPPLPLQAAE
jgi:hypothetical protein